MKQKKSTKGAEKLQHLKNSLETYKIIPTPNFVKQAKALKEKYPHIADDFYQLQQQLKNDPVTGNDPLGQSCYKVRMRIADKNCGERDGARVIIEVVVMDKRVYVLSVYDKSDKSDLEDGEIDKLLKKRLIFTK